MPVPVGPVRLLHFDPVEGVAEDRVVVSIARVDKHLQRGKQTLRLHPPKFVADVCGLTDTAATEESPRRLS